MPILSLGYFFLNRISLYCNIDNRCIILSRRRAEGRSGCGELSNLCRQPCHKRILHPCSASLPMRSGSTTPSSASQPPTVISIPLPVIIAASAVASLLSIFPLLNPAIDFVSAAGHSSSLPTLSTLEAVAGLFQRSFAKTEHFRAATCLCLLIQDRFSGSGFSPEGTHGGMEIRRLALGKASRRANGSSGGRRQPGRTRAAERIVHHTGCGSERREEGGRPQGGSGSGRGGGSGSRDAGRRACMPGRPTRAGAPVGERAADPPARADGSPRARAGRWICRSASSPSTSSSTCTRVMRGWVGGGWVGGGWVDGWWVAAAWGIRLGVGRGWCGMWGVGRGGGGVGGWGIWLGVGRGWRASGRVLPPLAS